MTEAIPETTPSCAAEAIGLRLAAVIERTRAAEDKAMEVTGSPAARPASAQGDELFDLERDLKGQLGRVKARSLTGLAAQVLALSDELAEVALLKEPARNRWRRINRLVTALAAGLEVQGAPTAAALGYGHFPANNAPAPGPAR